MLPALSPVNKPGWNTQLVFTMHYKANRLPTGTKPCLCSIRKMPFEVARLLTRLLRLPVLQHSLCGLSRQKHLNRSALLLIVQSQHISVFPSLLWALIESPVFLLTSAWNPEKVITFKFLWRIVFPLHHACWLLPSGWLSVHSIPRIYCTCTNWPVADTVVVLLKYVLIQPLRPSLYLSMNLLQPWLNEKFKFLQFESNCLYGSAKQTARIWSHLELCVCALCVVCECMDVWITGWEQTQRLII